MSLSGLSVHLALKGWSLLDWSRGMRCCQGCPFTRAQMLSQRTGFVMWIGTLCNDFYIWVLITVCAWVTVPALIRKALVYAGLNGFLTKLAWIRSSLLAFSRVLYPDSICQFELMTAPAYRLPFRFYLLQSFGCEGFSLASCVHPGCVSAHSSFCSWSSGVQKGHL